MKRIIAIVITAIPIGVTSLTAKSTSVADVSLQPKSIHSSSIVAQQDGDPNRPHDHHPNEIQREQAQRGSPIQGEDTRRTWVPGHWVNTLFGRQWIEGRWIFPR